MYYNSAAKSFHTQKLYIRLSSSEVHFRRENGHFILSPRLQDLGVTYIVHHRLIGKRIVDFLFVIILVFDRRTDMPGEEKFC